MYTPNVLIIAIIGTTETETGRCSSADRIRNKTSNAAQYLANYYYYSFKRRLYIIHSVYNVYEISPIRIAYVFTIQTGNLFRKTVSVLSFDSALLRTNVS